MILINFLFLILYFSNIFTADIPNFPHDHELESRNEYWINLNREEIKNSLKTDERNKKSKNVILFLGDGMSISTITAARILKGQLQGRSGEEGYLFFERKFPFSALIKTFNVDRLVPDSAGTATCYLSGVKANFEVIGVNAKINRFEKNCKKIQANKVTSVFEMARREGKSIGIVTTTRITHATPAAGYAHVAYREQESDLPEETKKDGCKDIARQLIEDEPGLSLNVIFGGGRQMFLPKSKNGKRTDNLDLIEKWKQIKSQKYSPQKYKYIETLDELKNIDSDEVEYLFGLFNESHLTYNTSLPLVDRKEPTLSEMTEAAIKILSKNKKGYVLLVEGGKIDLAHHDNLAYHALYETVHFDQTIERASKLVNQEETLILVTADHSHSLNLNGYPERGTNIFGFSHEREVDRNNKPTKPKFTILTYSTGPGKNDGPRPNPEEDKNLNTNKYVNYAGIREQWAFHNGVDVALFSNGWGKLVRGTKDQSFIGNIIAYTSCIGPYINEKHCQSKAQDSNGNNNNTKDSHITKFWWIYIPLAVVAFGFLGFYFYKRNVIV